MALRWRDYAPWVVALAFTVSGIIHLARPSTFTAIVPHVLPFAKELVSVSGGAELVCAAGLWRRTRWAAWAATALLIALWPANLQDAMTASQGHDTVAAILTWVRFPLQIPLIWCAWASGRSQEVAA